MTMGNDRLEILSCKIPRLSRRIATKRQQSLANYPLARASEWSPLPALPAPLSRENEEAEDLSD
jgi:hypothetical protein